MKSNLSGITNIYSDYIINNKDITTNTFLNQPISYFNGITSNIQQQINSIVTLSGLYINNSYNDIITLSGAIYNIQNTYPKYNDILTLSGAIYNISSTLSTNYVTYSTYNITNSIFNSNYVSKVYLNSVLNSYITLSGLTFTTNSPQITLVNGSLPTVAITKSLINNNVNFDFIFGIPTGPTGSQGGQGGQGGKGDRGDKGDTGDRGSNGRDGGSGASADPLSIVALVIAAFGIAALGAGEFSLQAQLSALQLKIATLDYLGLLTLITGDTSIIAPSEINFNSGGFINLTSGVQQTIQSSVVNISSIEVTNI